MSRIAKVIRRLREITPVSVRSAVPRSSGSPPWGIGGVALLVLLCAAGASAQIGQKRMGIRVLHPDGTAGRDVVSVPDRYHHGSPFWSPDGKRLVFDAYLQGLQDPTLFMVDVDGKNLRNLGSGAYPNWSPDGKQILFFSGLGDNPRISIMNVDGAQRRALLDGAWPAWSPDGKKMILSRSGPDSGIWTADANGANPQQLLLHEGLIFAPVWSRDGKRVAFASNAAGNFDIYTIDATGADLKQLTNHPDMELFPAWSPDGKRIAFTRYQGDTADLYLIDAGGGGETSLTSHPGFDIDPAWSPDGKWIAYGSQLQQ